MRTFLPCLIGLLASQTLALVVADLSGTPLAGIEVRQDGQSTSTGADGTWSILPTGLRPMPERPSSPALLRLTGPRLQVRWGSRDLEGRLRTALAPASSSVRPAALTKVADSATLSWNGKVLARLAGTDQASIDTLRLDTAWADDGGIPWNPRIEYGSLRDSRDGRTYRTVRIQAMTWMAENLQWSAPRSRLFRGERFYTWSSATGFDSTMDYTTPESFAPILTLPGICPEGWLLPDTSDLADLMGALPKTGTAEALQSLAGWPDVETYSPGWSLLPVQRDIYGFRALPTGVLDTTGASVGAGKSAAWWSFREPQITITMVGAEGIAALGFAVDSTGNSPKLSSYRKSMGLSVRCHQGAAR